MTFLGLFYCFPGLVRIAKWMNFRKNSNENKVYEIDFAVVYPVHDIVVIMNDDNNEKNGLPVAIASYK